MQRVIDGSCAVLKRQGLPQGPKVLWSEVVVDLFVSWHVVNKIIIISIVNYLIHYVWEYCHICCPGDEIADLNDRLIGLQQAKDTEKEQMETSIQAVRTEYQEIKDQLTSENMILGQHFNTFKHFMVYLLNKHANSHDVMFLWSAKGRL